MASESSSSGDTTSSYKFYHENLGTEIVDIYVGGDHGSPEDPMIFTIHKKLLTNKAPTFARLLSRQTLGDGMKQSINLPDVHPKVFDAFSYWLYVDDLPGYYDGAAEEEALTASERVKLVCFADKYGLMNLFDATFQTFQGFFTDLEEKVPSVQDIAYAYDKTPPTSKVRKALVHMFALRLCLDTPVIEEDDLKFLSGRSDIAFDVFQSMCGRTMPNDLESNSIKEVVADCLENHERKIGIYEGFSPQASARRERRVGDLIDGLRVDFHHGPLRFAMR